MLISMSMVICENTGDTLVFVHDCIWATPPPPPSSPLHVMKPSVNPLKRYIKLADTNGAHYSSLNQAKLI